MTLCSHYYTAIINKYWLLNLNKTIISASVVPADIHICNLIFFSIYRVLLLLFISVLLLTPWLMEPGCSMPHSQGLSNNHYPERINPIPSIDTYFFPVGVNFESTPTFFHSGYLTCPSQSSRLNHPDYIR